MSHPVDKPHQLHLGPAAMLALLENRQVPHPSRRLQWWKNEASTFCLSFRSSWLSFRTLSEVEGVGICCCSAAPPLPATPNPGTVISTEAVRAFANPEVGNPLLYPASSNRPNFFSPITPQKHQQIRMSSPKTT
jgi:hypothetical protein